MHTSFTNLDHFLTTYQRFWRYEPFYLALEDETPPWAEQYPDLLDALNRTSDEEILALKQTPQRVQAFLLPWLPELSDMVRSVALPSHTLSPELIDSRLGKGIPGRKRDQINALASYVLEEKVGESWLEWCSGKGYLGRVLAAKSGKPVISLEFQKSLCDSGQKEADALQLPMTFVHGDALDPNLKLAFSSCQHAVGLHACGDLHINLLKRSVEHQVSAVSIAPCCYHLTRQQRYQGLSSIGQSSQLTLTKQELRIPLQQTVTGGKRVQRHRYQEMVFRLAFDALVRDKLGLTQYLPIPSVKKSQLGEGFTAFCHWAAKSKDLLLPDCDYDDFEALGVERYWKMERWSLVQTAFHRLIEIWLIMDRACYLQEQGYTVKLTEFCAREITPRNILIQAIKK